MLTLSSTVYIALCLWISTRYVQARSVHRRAVSPRDPLFQCSFESHLDLCFGSQYAKDQFNWTVGSGNTPSMTTGPISASDGSNYMFIEASYPQLTGDEAIYLFPDIFSPAEYCVQFAYHMYGDHVGSLRIVQMANIDTAAPDTVVAWEMNGDKGGFWMGANVTVLLRQNYRIAIVGRRGDGYRGDIAVDDITVYADQCNDVQPIIPEPTKLPEIPAPLTTTTKSATTVSPTIPPTPRPLTPATATSAPATPAHATPAPATPAPATPAPATPAPATPAPATPAPATPEPRSTMTTSATSPASSDFLFKCSFESSASDAATWCNMEQSVSEDVFDWTRQSGPTRSEPTGPRKAYAGDFYIYIEASNQRNGDNALIYLPSLGSDGPACVRFAFNMFGFHIAKLELVKLSSGALTTEWSMVGNKGKPWYEAEVNVNLTSEDKLGFRAHVGNAYSGDIAVDGIQVYSGSCKGGTPIVPDKKTTTHAPTTTTKARMTTTTTTPTTTTTTTPTTTTTAPTTTTIAHITTTTTAAKPPTNTPTTTTTNAPITTTTTAATTTTTRSSEPENPETAVDWECYFEDLDGNEDHCNIDHEQTVANFNWTYHTGPTPSSQTGPSSAHSGNYYAYIEATGRTKGDRAILRLPSMDVVGRMCLQFEYHMYGHHVDTLQVGVFHNNITAAYNVMWSLSGEQGDQWMHAQLMVDLTSADDQIAIVGVRGSEYAGDIAIDSLKISSATCQVDLPNQP